MQVLAFGRSRRAQQEILSAGAAFSAPARLGGGLVRPDLCQIDLETGRDGAGELGIADVSGGRRVPVAGPLVVRETRW
jgi:hypothetical protein